MRFPQRIGPVLTQLPTTPTYSPFLLHYLESWCRSRHESLSLLSHVPLAPQPCFLETSSDRVPANRVSPSTKSTNPLLCFFRIASSYTFLRYVLYQFFSSLQPALCLHSFLLRSTPRIDFTTGSRSSRFFQFWDGSRQRIVFHPKQLG